MREAWEEQTKEKRDGLAYIKLTAHRKTIREKERERESGCETNGQMNQMNINT